MSEVDVEMRVENWYALFLILSLCIRTLVRLKVCENLKTNHYVSLVTWDFLLLEFYQTRIIFYLFVVLGADFFSAAKFSLYY